MSNTSDNMRGAIFMMLALAGYVLNDTMMKLVSADLALAQAVFIRGLVATALLAAVAQYKGALFYRPDKHTLKIIVWRAFGEIAATFCFLTALFNMPLANATAILQSLPLAVTLAASLFLGVKVGWQRYLAIFIGFCGVMIIIRPGGEGFNSYSLWALAAVGFVTLRDLLATRLPASTPSTYVAMFTSVGVTLVAGIVAAMQEWRPVSVETTLQLSAAAGFLLVGYVAAVTAMRFGEIAFVSPFRYSGLIWALILGILVFGDFPDGWTMLGISIVVSTGIFTFYRERRTSQKAANQ